MFLQACKDVSSTWTSRLRTIYWDATTAFPECVILNIREIQESTAKDGVSGFPGLENLCIDYVERTTDDSKRAGKRREFRWFNEHARRMTFFSAYLSLVNMVSPSDTRIYPLLDEPIWKLGPITLSKLKFFSLAPPFWANVSERVRNPARSSLNGIIWLTEPGLFGQCTGMPEKPLKDYCEDTGPALYYTVLQSIQPEIFFSSTPVPFYCKELLPCWARIRCIYIFGLVVLTNSEDTKSLEFPKYNDFFQTQKFPDRKVFSGFRPNKKVAGQYLRGAIQLRSALELLARKLGGRPLTGEDITAFANGKEKQALHWTEHWQFTISQQLVDGQVEEGEAQEIFPVYKEWLQDTQLAEQVAKAYNQGVKEHDGARYPFCHSESPGKVYFETSKCKSLDHRVWLDRPKHRGCYSHINIEDLPKLRYESTRDTDTFNRHLTKFPFYLPSL